MPECPISFSALFQLVVAVEGLSLWGAFNTLPNSSRRINLKQSLESWEKEADNLPGKKKHDLYMQFAKDCTKFESRALQVRIIKTIPSGVLIAMLLVYVGCPIVTGHSASVLLAPWWRWLCLALFGFMVGRLIWFLYLMEYFNSFESKYKSCVKFEEDSNPNDFCVVDSSSPSS